MKRFLLFFCCILIISSFFVSRYYPVSLDRVRPIIKTVEVKGQVNQPGIYTMPIEATLQDCINKAGGLKNEADTDTLALATIVEDGQVIVIDKKQTIEKISINSADVNQLDTLPGIGPAMAQRIIDYRNTTPFNSIEQLKEVKGIGDASFEKLRDLIRL